LLPLWLGKIKVLRSLYPSLSRLLQGKNELLARTTLDLCCKMDRVKRPPCVAKFLMVHQLLVVFKKSRLFCFNLTLWSQHWLSKCCLKKWSVSDV
jgi:hypothetical protein